MRAHGALLMALALLAGCQGEGDPARTSFYAWRTRLDLGRQEAAALGELGVRELRVRVFDLVAGPGGAVPTPAVRVSGLPAGTAVRPVVFLREAVFRDGRDHRALADSLLALADRVCARERLACRNLELDCDWTAGSREGFFALAGRLRAALRMRSQELSATWRLHQARDPDAAGVPPVDRLVLMAYNMGPVTADPGRASILDLAELDRWLRDAPPPPLPVDVALPVWSWTLQVRGGRAVDLFQDLSEEDLSRTSGLRRRTDGLWEVVGPGFPLRGRWLRAGDRLKPETPSARDLELAARSLDRWLPRDTARTVVFFSLSERNLERHGTKELDRLRRCLGGSPRRARPGLRPRLLAR